MTEELNSRALLHLVDHDYAVLRQWRRECSLQTYLTTVIARVFLDLRNKEWGKAKPPAMARRLGAVALLLWRLTHRKRLSFDEAVKALQAEHGVTASRDELWAMHAQLPAPSARYFVGVERTGRAWSSRAPMPRCWCTQIERRRLAARVERALRRALIGTRRRGPPHPEAVLPRQHVPGRNRPSARHRSAAAVSPLPRAADAACATRSRCRASRRADIGAIVGVADLEHHETLLEATGKMRTRGRQYT